MNNNLKLRKFFNIYDWNFYETNFRKQRLFQDLQLLLPTSGSMGVSKFVKLSRKNLYHNTQSIIKYLKLNKRDRAITNMPFYYSYMLSIINTHLEVGGSVIVTKHFVKPLKVI